MCMEDRNTRPIPTGNWSIDNQAGHNHANNIIIAMKRTHETFRLKQEVDALRGAGDEHNGILIGFLHRFAEVAIRAT